MNNITVIFFEDEEQLTSKTVVPVLKEKSLEEEDRERDYAQRYRDIKSDNERPY